MELEVFGKGGERLRLEAGDVAIMPAGVSHNMTGHSDDVLLVGGYPAGRDWDNIANTSLTEERRRAAFKRIMMLPIPDGNPVNGEPIREWIEAPSSVDAGWNKFRDDLDLGCAWRQSSLRPRPEARDHKSTCPSTLNRIVANLVPVT